MSDKRCKSSSPEYTAKRNVGRTSAASLKINIFLCLPINAEKLKEEYQTMTGIY